MATASFGLGTLFDMNSSILPTPMFSFAEQQSTGNTLLDANPNFKPLLTSSMVKSPWSKYFSIKSSAPAAAFSTKVR